MSLSRKNPPVSLRCLAGLLLLFCLFPACSKKPQSVPELFPDMIIDEKAAAKQFTVKARETDPTIDDLEDGDLNGLKVDGRDWSWEQFDDATDGTQYLTIIQPEDAPTPGENVLYVRGGGWSEWGGGVGAGLVHTTAPGGYGCYDASVYTGIRFWVKTIGLAQMTVRVATPETTGGYNGGICLENCPGGFSHTVAVGENWIQVEIPFDAFTLSNGEHTLYLDPARIKSLHFVFETLGDYEVLLDGLTFF